MAKRDIEKTANKVKGLFDKENGLDAYDLNGDDLERLYQLVLENRIWDTVITAFRYGFVMGHRATVAGKIAKKI